MYVALFISGRDSFNVVRRSLRLAVDLLSIFRLANEDGFRRGFVADLKIDICSGANLYDLRCHRYRIEPRTNYRQISVLDRIRTRGVIARDYCPLPPN